MSFSSGNIIAQNSLFKTPIGTGNFLTNPTLNTTNQTSFFGAQHQQQAQQMQSNQTGFGIFGNQQQTQQVQSSVGGLGFQSANQLTQPQSSQPTSQLLNKPQGSTSFPFSGSSISTGFPSGHTTNLLGTSSNLTNSTQNSNLGTSNLFNMNRPTGAPVQQSNILGRSGQTSGTIITNTQQGLGQFMQPSQQMNIHQLQIGANYKKESDRKEIIDVLQSYLNCLNIQSPYNSFKYMFYNRISEEYAYMLNSLQQPKQYGFTEDGQPFLIDQELWHKALRNNPDQSIFYPSQISSPKELESRVKILEVLEFQKLDFLLNLRKKINSLSLIYDNEIQNLNSTIKNKLNLIKHKQMNVIYKLEKLAILTGKAEKNYNLENKLNLKLNELKYAITNKDSYVNRIKNLSSMTTLMSFDNTAETEEDPLKDFSKERFEKNIIVLKNMKKIFDINFSKLKKCSSDLTSVRNDMDNFKKYDRINK